jgi:hypothetical protein
MVGNNSASVVADAVLKGLTRKEDIQALYDCIVYGTENVHPEVSSSGRLGHQWYNTLGYIPYNVGIDENVARTLEYAYNDWCILQMAKKIGRPAEELEKWEKRSQNWKNVFDKQKKRKNAHFDALALKVHELHKRLRCQEHEIEFDLTDKQKEKFNAHFNSLQNSLIDDDNFSATIRRMGIITFRIAMILSALRIKSKRSNINKIICSDIDFESALKISKSLLEHANFLYKTLPEGEKAIQNKIKRRNKWQICSK